MINRNKKNNKGFTLVELLVVIAIIGILAVVAVPSLFKQMDKTKATQVVANVKAVQTEALTTYSTSESIKTTITNTTISDAISSNDIKSKETYLLVALDASGVETTTDANMKKLAIKVTATANESVINNAAQQLGLTYDKAKKCFIFTIAE